MEALTLQHPEHPHSRFDIARVAAYKATQRRPSKRRRFFVPLAFIGFLPSFFLLLHAFCSRQNYTRDESFSKEFCELQFESRLAICIFCHIKCKTIKFVGFFLNLYKIYFCLYKIFLTWKAIGVKKYKLRKKIKIFIKAECNKSFNQLPRYLSYNW